MSQYAFVGQNSTNQSGVTTTIQTVYSPTAGNLLVFAVYGHVAETVTMSDSNGGNIYSSIASTTNVTDNYFLYSFFVPNCKGGSTTFTATYSASTTFSSLYVGEYSGVANIANPLVGSGQGFILSPGTSTNAISSSSAVPSQVPYLLWGFCGGVAPTNPPVAGSGFTGQSSVWGSAATGEDALILSASAQSALFTAGAASGVTDYAVVMGQFVLTPILMGQACL